MVTLANFPQVSQKTNITSDHRQSEDALFECVPASIGAAILYYEGKSQWDEEINPDRLKDASYPGEYTGTTAARAYVDICEHLGYKLWALDGENGYLVQQIHAEIKQGHPVIFTEPDPYVPASYNWSHVVVAYGEDTGEITFMDPFVARSMVKSDSELVGLLEFKQIWIVEPLERITEEVPIVINLNTPGVGAYFDAGPGADQWRCRQTGVPLQGAILAEYCRYGNAGLCGLTFLGLPKSNELPVGTGVARKQFFERGVLIYDPKKEIDNPPGAGEVYAAHLYGGPGEDPMVATQAGIIRQLQAQKAVASVPPALIADMQQIVMKATTGKY